MYGMYGRDAALESRGTAVLGPDLGAFRLFGRTYRGLQILWPHVLKTIFFWFCYPSLRPRNGIAKWPKVEEKGSKVQGPRPTFLSNKATTFANPVLDCTCTEL